MVSRDRVIHLDGITRPIEFYHRDYSGSTPVDTTDHRRTLYWNPHAHPDEMGMVKAKFYNSARRAMIKVSICGVGSDGRIYYY